jgi:hypothetical protein
MLHLTRPPKDELYRLVALPPQLGGRRQDSQDRIHIHAGSVVTTNAVGQHPTAAGSWDCGLQSQWTYPEFAKFFWRHSPHPDYVEWYGQHISEPAPRKVDLAGPTAPTARDADREQKWQTYLNHFYGYARNAICYEGNSAEGYPARALTCWYWTEEDSEHLHRAELLKQEPVHRIGL